MEAHAWRKLIPMVSLLPLLGPPAPAVAAHFGQGKSGSGASSGSASRSGNSGAHGAAPVGTPSAVRPAPGFGVNRGTDYRHYWVPEYRGWRRPSPWGYATSYYGYSPPYPYVYPYVPYGAPYVPAYGFASPGLQAREAPALFLSLGLDGAVGRSGAASAFGGTFAIEGERFGLNTQITGIRFRYTDDPLPGSGNSVGLANAFLTFAVVATPIVRIRIEAGVMSAFAPALVAVGPGMGISGTVRVASPVRLEASAHATPYPFDEFDWNAGVSVALGPIALRGGWRRVWLNDRGLVDGISNQDVFSGPYFGISFPF